MKNINKILAVSMVAMLAVPATHAKIVSETMLTKTAGTYDKDHTVQMAIDTKQDDLTVMSVSEGTTGTATTERSMDAAKLKEIVQGTNAETNPVNGLAANAYLTGYTKGSSNAAVATTDTIKTAIGKLENQIAGKQASGSYVPTTRKVNNKELSSDVTLTGADVATTGYTKASTAAAITAGDTVNVALGKLEKTLDGKVASNTAITGATKTKITYDSKGLVTSGADLAISDLPESIVVAGTNTTVTHAADGDYAVNVADASTTGKGVIEIATAAEAKAGAETALAITPETLHKFVGTVSGTGNSLSQAGHYVLTADVDENGVATYYWEDLGR